MSSSGTRTAIVGGGIVALLVALLARGRGASGPGGGSSPTPQPPTPGTPNVPPFPSDGSLPPGFGPEHYRFHLVLGGDVVRAGVGRPFEMPATLQPPQGTSVATAADAAHTSSTMGFRVSVWPSKGSQQTADELFRELQSRGVPYEVVDR